MNNNEELISMLNSLLGQIEWELPLDHSIAIEDTTNILKLNYNNKWHKLKDFIYVNLLEAINKRKNNINSTEYYLYKQIFEMMDAIEKEGLGE